MSHNTHNSSVYASARSELCPHVHTEQPDPTDAGEVLHVGLPYAQTFRHECEVKRLQQEVTELRKLQVQHDQTYTKFKDLKLDYRQLLDQFEKSETLRRDQKKLMQDQKQDVSRLKK